jgi:hypothetical protein
MNRWIKLGNEEWGALIYASKPPQYGEAYVLLKQKGGESKVHIDECLVSFEGKHFCSIIYKDQECDATTADLY